MNFGASALVSFGDHLFPDPIPFCNFSSSSSFY